MIGRQDKTKNQKGRFSECIKKKKTLKWSTGIVVGLIDAPELEMVSVLSISLAPSSIFFFSAASNLSSIFSGLDEFSCQVHLVLTE